MKVLIAGGGIGGLVAAIALAQRGFEVEVLEQQAEPRELGAGIAIQANGARVLTSLGLDAALAPLRHCSAGFRFRAGRSGRVIIDGKIGWYEARFGARPYNLHRGDLRRVLLDAALAQPSVRIQLGQRVVSIVQRPEAVSVAMEQGLQASGDVLIGADGIHSVVRREIAGPDAPRFSGEVVWRGLVRRERLTGVASACAALSTIWAGSDRHFLAYPIRGEELLNIGGFVESDEWQSESWTEAGSTADFARLFARFHPVVRDTIAAADECFVQAIHQREPLTRWFVGRCVLLGDACHAMLPHLGQGAGLAIEDALVLARALADHREDLDRALRTYQDKRKERVARIAAEVRARGRQVNFGNPIRGALLLTSLWVASRLLPPPERFSWIDGYDALSA